LLKGLKHNAESITKDDIITPDSLSGYIIDEVTKLPSKKRAIPKTNKKSF
jgi:hypothetical protein